MTNDKIVIKKIKGVSELNTDFEFPESNLIVVTGRNGIGKTTLVEAFKLISEPQVFEKTAGINAIRPDSSVTFELNGHPAITFSYNSTLGVLDTKQTLPKKDTIISELPIPHGERFQQFSLIANYDTELRINIASSDYTEATDLQYFLNKVYCSAKFDNLKVTKIKKYHFYFILKENDYYIREDHFSSGEFFLIQLYRLITSGAELILIDELDVALDASAQVNLYKAIKPILNSNNSRLIVISHSLAFMNTIDDGGLYYLENIDGSACLENRSFGYIKSDLYGFRGKDRYIITEDDTLVGFLKYLITTHIKTFYEYEIIAVGGQAQVKLMADKNDLDNIFGSPEQLIIVVDKDIFGKVGYSGPSLLLSSPVNDIEVFIWENKNRLLPNVTLPKFQQKQKEKNKAKTFWNETIKSKQKTRNDLYALVESENRDVSQLIDSLKNFLCLKK